MQYQKYLETHIEDEVSKNISLPKGYHVIGHVALLSTSILDYNIITRIAELTLNYDRRVRSVAIRTGPTRDVERIPSYKVFAGNPNTLTTHIENGVKFRIDPLKITFSRGNRGERIAFPQRVEDNEHVIDMFACVGQFGLHIAARTEAKVTAIEINPVAYRFLEENIRLNNVQDRMQAVLGDCRQVKINTPGDRIVMGYLHNTIDYLPAALNLLSHRGGWIHIHTSIPQKEVLLISNTINTLSEKADYESQVHTREIKHYSPGIVHYVFDVELSKL